MSDQRHNAYLPGYGQVKHHEWRTVENSAAYILPDLQKRVGSNPGLKLLDVGAGSGTITASIAKYMPEGQITAVDLSDDILSRAASHAQEKGINKVSFEKASVYELSKHFSENTFDIVHAHQVLVHLDSPEQAMAEMLKVVKPGGIVAVREIDMRMWSIYPETPVMKTWLRVQLGTHIASGGSSNAGCSLIAWAMKAGAKREDIRAGMGTWMYSTPEERHVWGGTFKDRILRGEMRRKALDEGLATEAQLDEMGREWERWIETEDACCGTMHGEILVTK